MQNIGVLRLDLLTPSQDELDEQIYAHHVELMQSTSSYVCVPVTQLGVSFLPQQECRLRKASSFLHHLPLAYEPGN